MQPLQKDASEPSAAETEQDFRDSERREDSESAGPAGASEANAQAAQKGMLGPSGGMEPVAEAATGQGDTPPLEVQAWMHKVH